MLILAVLLVVLVLAVLAAAGTAAFGGGRGERSLLGGAGPPLVLLGGAVVVVVLGVAAVSMVGLRGGGGGDREPAAVRPPETSPPAPAPVPAPAATEPVDDAPARPAGAGPKVAITSGASATVVDRLPDGAVLVVTAKGFEPGTGQVAQCGPAFEGSRGCVNRFPVEFDGDGTARFQYLVSDRVAPGSGVSPSSTGRCGAGQTACLVVVFGRFGERGSAFTVFHDPAPPPGLVAVEPRAGLSNGDVVTVRASGFPPATRLFAAQCPPGTEVDPGRCRGAASTTTSPDGDAVLRLTMRTGEVDGFACGPRRPCSVRAAAEAPVAPVTVPVTFTTGPSARYNGGRVAAGLALATLLLALARRLVRTTDWREPAAASTPEMDRAVLDA